MGDETLYICITGHNSVHTVKSRRRQLLFCDIYQINYFVDES